MHKPRLIPVSVPWAISSVPQFRISESPEGQIASIAFTAFFFLEDVRAGSTICETVVIASEPPPFSRALSDQGAIYRRVRVAFQGTVFSEMNDHDEFPEREYDWSSLPVYKHNARSVGEYRTLTQRHWAQTGLAPNPGMYEVDRSPLLSSLRCTSGLLRHFVLIGEDQFFNVVAIDWKWEAGQEVEV